MAENKREIGDGAAANDEQGMVKPNSVVWDKVATAIRKYMPDGQDDWDMLCDIESAVAAALTSVPDRCGVVMGTMNGVPFFCNAEKGHIELHSYTTPFQSVRDWPPSIICSMCSKLPEDINPTLTQLALDICQKIKRAATTDADVDWVEDQISRFLNYAMQKPAVAMDLAMGEKP